MTLVTPAAQRIGASQIEAFIASAFQKVGISVAEAQSIAQLMARLIRSPVKGK